MGFLNMAESEGFTRAFHGALPSGSLRLCKTAIVPFCRTTGLLTLTQQQFYFGIKKPATLCGLLEYGGE